MSDFHQLLILGNGFDLQCGLASKFDDFERSRRNEIDKIVNRAVLVLDDPVNVSLPGGDPHASGAKVPASLYKNSLTVWDLILKATAKHRHWYDIETGIKLFLLGQTNGSSLFNKIILNGKNYYAGLKKAGRGARISDIDHHVDSEDNKYACYADDEYFHALPPADMITSMLIHLYGWDGNKREVLFDYLMQELQRLEHSFCEYMSDQVAKTARYTDSCQKMIVALINDRLPSLAALPVWQGKPKRVEYDSKTRRYVSNADSVSILDFNYTNPMAGVKHSPLLTNIHGNLLEGNTIFGIDESDLEKEHRDYDQLIAFTKTFRLMAFHYDNIDSLIYPYTEGHPGAETAIIKFYGHSLSTADYSYFQSLFDAVDLYESRTRLIFYFRHQQRRKRKNGNSAGNSEAIKMYKNVRKLISRYGQTLDNEDHGRNLLHKLLLEGRLSVVESPI